MPNYCDEEDLYLAFGKDNIRKWADLQSTDDDDTTQERIDWACGIATEQTNDRLRHGPYTFPVELGSGDAYPAMLVRMTALLAGATLYEARGITDAAEDAEHSLRWAEKKWDKW